MKLNSLIISLLALCTANLSQAQDFYPDQGLDADLGIPFRAVSRAVSGTSPILNVKVINAATGEPITDATVLVGEAEGVPFAGNRLVTDAAGAATFDVRALTPSDLVTVTAKKAGYHTFTLFNSVGRDVELYLQPTSEYSDYHMQSGHFNNWPAGIPRSDAEAGVFLPALRVNSMLNFDLGQVISSFQDEITVVGRQVKVPGNLVLPPQDKTYGFFSVHLEKPDFHMPLPNGSQSYMTALMGSAPLSGMVSHAQNKDFLGAINLMKFSRVDWSDWMTVTGNAAFDITVNRSLAQQTLFSEFANVPASLDLVAFALVDPTGEGKALVPMDVKSLPKAAVNSAVPRFLTDYVRMISDVKTPRTEIKLASLASDPNGAQNYVFSAVLDQAEFSQSPVTSMRFSAALSPAALENGHKTAHTDHYLELITQNSVSADQHTYQFDFNASRDLVPDFLVLNVFTITTDATSGMQYRKLLWASILPASTRSVTLPDVDGQSILPPVDPSGQTKNYWEVIAVHRDIAQSPGLWDSVITVQNLKHLSHATKTF